NGKFIENLSNLQVSYDHHIGNLLEFEFYTFLKRSSNSFLNIDQRYEIGAGGIWNFAHSGKRVWKKRNDTAKVRKITKNSLTQLGQDKYSSVNAVQEAVVNLEDQTLVLCTGQLCIIPLKNLSKPEIKAFVKSKKRTLKSFLKQHSKIRASLLAGVNYESERTPDSLKLYYTETITEPSNYFQPVNLIRAVVAPGVSMHIGDFQFTSRFYAKVAVSHDDFENKVFEGTLTDRKKDYRFEWVSSAGLNFNDKIGLKGQFMYVHINAPRRRFFELPDGGQGLYTSPNRFANFTMALTYKL
ncbi:MAG: hypothetical protein ACPG7E_06660, partial [Marinirhabdus sp.]